MITFPGPLLVGVDRSPTARRALLAAVELARACGAPLHLAHVRLRRPQHEDQSMSPEERGRSDREAAELLADEAIAARERGVEIASTHVRYADRLELGLLEVRRELDAGLLVVGAGQASGGLFDTLHGLDDASSTPSGPTGAAVLVVG